MAYTSFIAARKFTRIICAISLTFMMFFSITTYASESVKGKRYEIPEGGFVNNFTTEELDTYLNKLEKAVKNDDFDEIAQLVSYPLTFNMTIKDKSELKQMYPQIFNDVVKKAAIEGKIAELNSSLVILEAGNTEVDSGMIRFDPRDGISSIEEGLSPVKNPTKKINGKRYKIPKGGFSDTSITTKILDTYLNKLEKAVKNDDFDEIAQLVSYPLTFNMTIKDKSELKQMYPIIFNDVVKKAAIEEEVSEVGYRGLMIGDGTIWFDPKNGIFSINDPGK